MGNDSLAPAARVSDVVQNTDFKLKFKFNQAGNGKRPIHWNLNRGLGIVTVTVTRASGTASEKRDL